MKNSTKRTFLSNNKTSLLKLFLQLFVEAQNKFDLKFKHTHNKIENSSECSGGTCCTPIFLI